MFSRLRVTTKILVILIPPVLALAAFAGVAAMDRIDDRSTAEAAVAVSSTSEAIREFTYRVQAERLGVSAALADEQPLDSPKIVELRAATDVAGEGLLGAATALSGSAAADLGLGTETVLAEVEGALAGLTAAREAANAAGADVQEVFADYTEVSAAMVRLSSGIARSSDVPRRATQALHWAEAGVEAEALAGTAALIGLTDPDLAGWANGVFAQRASIARNAFETYAVDASAIGRTTIEEARASAAIQDSSGWFDAGSDEALSTMPSNPEEWATLMENRLAAYATAETVLLRSDLAVASQAATDADRSMKLFIGIAALVLVGAIALAVMAARSIIANLRQLTDAARNISAEQLPDLVRSLNSPDDSASLTFRRVDLETHDEFGEVADALNGLGATVVEVGEQQRATLRKGISDIFVNLARRNQSLLDRQIEFIDVLEANEENPDQLENLFRLDHLATRMRRNAESLLVLAGSEPPRRRLQEISLSDVIRVAIGEVEDYSRIVLTGVDDASTTSGTAVDIAHLLSELMENGTVYSPPETSVEISGSLTTDGGYLITVVDQGVGMTADQVESANHLMAHPPAVGLNLSRSLGFTVVATLAARHGLGVTFVSMPNEGVAVHVGVPAHLLNGPDPIPEIPTATQTPELVAAAAASGLDEGPAVTADDPMIDASSTEIPVPQFNTPAPGEPSPWAEATTDTEDVATEEATPWPESTDEEPAEGASPWAESTPTEPTTPTTPVAEQASPWAESTPTEPTTPEVPAAEQASPWAETTPTEPTTPEVPVAESGSQLDWGSAVNDWEEPLPDWARTPAEPVSTANTDPGLDAVESSPWDSAATPFDAPGDTAANAYSPADPATTPDPVADVPVGSVPPVPWETVASPFETSELDDIHEADPVAEHGDTEEPGVAAPVAPEERVGSLHAAATLDEAIADGRDLDSDLAALLDEESDPQGTAAAESETQHLPPATMGDLLPQVTAEGLPQRHPGQNTASFEPPEAVGRVASPLRPPEQIRQNLANYRAGRRSGRSSVHPPSPESADEERPKE